jgi:ubiquinone/menaquinone biosynthesis C-methylase UbiE
MPGPNPGLDGPLVWLFLGGGQGGVSGYVMASKLIKRVRHIELYRERAALEDAHLLTGRGEARAHTDFVNRNVLAHLTLAPHIRMLDIGCGDGGLLALAAPHIADGLGILPTEEERRRLQSSAHPANISYDVGLSTSLPAPDRSFDIVVMNSVLHILSSLSEATASFAEIGRVARLGGLIWIGEAVCSDNDANRKTYAGSSAIGYIQHAAKRRGWRGAKRAVKEVAKAALLGKPIELKMPQLITSESWIEKTAAAHGMETVSSEVHYGLDKSGQPQPSDCRRDFLLRKLD